jgi:glycosyltransferase involved in cell wall biosynthesis
LIYDYAYPPAHHAYELVFNAFKYVRRDLPKLQIEREPPTTCPRVSVVIPTYNYSNVLRCALTSVLWQTYRDFEVLVVGDGCTDDSEQVVASFGDARLRWHNFPANSGNQVQPKNWGLRNARGTYIAHLQHDDVWHPEHLATLVRTLEEGHTEWVYGLLENIGPPGSNVRFVTGIYSSGIYEPGHGITSSSVLHTRELALRIGGLKDANTIWRTPDCDFTLRAWEACGNRFAASNELTGFKFPSYLRKNCYVDKPSFQQEAYVHAIRTDRLFMPREALAILLASLRQLPVHKPDFPEPPSPPPPGWWMEQHRKIRGLSAPANAAPSITQD